MAQVIDDKGKQVDRGSSARSASASSSSAAPKASASRVGAFASRQAANPTVTAGTGPRTSQVGAFAAGRTGIQYSAAVGPIVRHATNPGPQARRNSGSKAWAQAYDNFANSVYNYANSGATDYNTTRSYLKEAEAQYDFASTQEGMEDAAEYWQNMAGHLQNQLYLDNATRHEQASARKSELATTIKEAKQALNNARAGTLQWVDGVPTMISDPEEVARLEKEYEGYRQEEADLDELIKSWGYETNEERDALIDKMHANAGFMRGGLTASEQERLVALDAQFGNGDVDYGKDFIRRGAAAAGAVKQGLEGIAHTGYAAADFLVNRLPHVFDKPANWLVEHSDFLADIDALVTEMVRLPGDAFASSKEAVGGLMERDAAKYGMNVSGDAWQAKFWQAVNKYGPEVVQALPMALVAYATAGTSTLKDAAVFGGTAYGDTLAAASEMAQLSELSGLEGLATRCGKAIGSMASDPNFQVAFLQELGGGYDEAIADGASEKEAVAYAIINAWGNAALEIGGGIQDMPGNMAKAVQSGKKDVLMAYAKSVVEEGIEEVEQGAASAAMKGLYQDVELFSTENEDAVINPNRAVEEMKGGAVVAGVLGLPSSVSHARAIDKANRAAHNSGSDVERGSSDVDQMEGYAERAEEVGVGSRVDTEESETSRAAANLTTDAAREEMLAEHRENQRRALEEGRAYPEELAAEAASEETGEAVDADGNETANEGTAEPNESLPKRESAQKESLKEERSDEEAPLANGSINADEQAELEAARAEIEAEDERADYEARMASIEADEQGERTAEDDARAAKADIQQGKTNNKQLASVVPQVDPYITTQTPVANIRENIFSAENSKNSLPFTKRVAKFFEDNFGGKVFTKKLGGGADVIINERGIKNDVAHGLGEAKAMTFQAIPAVLKNGTVVSTRQDADGVKSYIIAAPVRLGGKPANVYCVVKVDGQSNNRFYLHEVSDSKGNLYYQLDESGAIKKAPPALQDSTQPKLGSADEVVDTVTQTGEKVNEGDHRDDTSAAGAHSENDRRINQKSARTIPAGQNAGRGKAGRSIPGSIVDNTLSAWDWEDVADEYESKGCRIIPESEHSEKFKTLSRLLRAIGINNITLIDAQGTKQNTLGFVIASDPGAGIFLIVNSSVDPSSKMALRTVIHEALHLKYEQSKKTISFTSIIEKTRKAIDVTGDLKTAIDRAHYAYMADYSDVYVDGLPANWSDRSADARMIWIKTNLNDRDANMLTEAAAQEMACDILSGDFSYFESKNDMLGFSRTLRSVLTEAGIFAEDECDTLIDAVMQTRAKDYGSRYAIDKNTGEIVERNREEAQPGRTKQPSKAALHGEHEQSSQSNRPQPSGKRKTTQSALEENTQIRGARDLHDERKADIGKRFDIGDGTFVSMKREEVSRIADYCIKKYGAEAEYERLLNKKDWDRLDYSIAGKLSYEMTKDLNRRMAQGKLVPESSMDPVAGETQWEFEKRVAETRQKAYLAERERIDALMQSYAERKSVMGQNLQEQYKFNQADEIRMRAAQRFLNWSVDGNFTQGSRRGALQAKMFNIVDDLLMDAEKAFDAGDAKGIADVAKKTSYIRGRQNLLGKHGVKGEAALLDRFIESGIDNESLAALAYGNINRIVDDFTPMSWADIAQTVRVNNMLSNVATGVNNLLNNAVGVRLGAIAQDAAIPAAKAFEKITGKKVAMSENVTRLKEGTWRAEMLALQYAELCSYYGINVENGRLDMQNSANFNVNGTKFERFLARYNYFVNAFVLNPDAAAKARVEANLQAGIDARFTEEELATPEGMRNKAELEAYKKHEANRRTLQDDNEATALVKHFKDAVNRKLSFGSDEKIVGGRRVGKVGAGDFLMAFAKVPTNVVMQKIGNTPYGAAYHLAQYAMGLKKAKSMHEAAINGRGEEMSAKEMAKLARNAGRAATTAGMIGLGVLAGMAGAIKDLDDDDDDDRKLAREKGFTGLNFNVDALFRRGDEWDWDNDHIISGDFLELLATPLAIGSLIWDAMQDDMNVWQATWYATNKSFTDVLDAISDIPGLQQAGDLYEAYTYAKASDNDANLEKLWKATSQYAASSATSFFVPNAIAQLDAGLDNTARDIYNANSNLEVIRNIFASKTPLRRLLPASIDSWGNERTYGDNTLMGAINKTLLPGDTYKLRQSDAEREIRRLNKAGFGNLAPASVPSKLTVDETDYKLTADQKRTYKQNYGEMVDDLYAEAVNSEAYQGLEDYQKQSVLKQLRATAKHVTEANVLYESYDVDNAVTFQKWELLASDADKVQWLCAREQAKALWDSEENVVADYAGMDAFLKGDYSKLSKEQRDVLNNSYGHIDDLYSARKAGINSEMWQKGYNVWKKYHDAGGSYKGTDVSAMDVEIQKATGANEAQMKWFRSNLKLYNQFAADNEKYRGFVDSGWDRTKAKALTDSIAALTPLDGKKTVSYKQRLTAIAKQTGLTEDQRWEAFYEYCPESYTNVLKKAANARRTGQPFEMAMRQIGCYVS